MADCGVELAGLVLLSVALLISLSVNVILYIRRRDTSCIDTYECCYPHINEEESPLQDEGQHFHNSNHREQQEIPIYGNISSDRRGSMEVCYETMTMQRTRDRMQPDLNYASLDLKLAMKHKKKHRHQQGRTHGRNKLQDQLPLHLTPPGSAFSEVEADRDAGLPPRDTSTMVSHISIYLNSEQIAQETEEMERERGISMEREGVGWEGLWEADRRSAAWKGEQVSEEKEARQHCSNESLCAQLPKAIQTPTILSEVSAVMVSNNISQTSY